MTSPTLTTFAAVHPAGWRSGSAANLATTSYLRVGPMDLTDPAHVDRPVTARDRADRACSGLLGLLLGSHYGVTTSTPAAAPTLNTPGAVEWTQLPNLNRRESGASTDADVSPVENVWNPVGAKA